tara:strand:- start:512 stop:1591 length:1080 start_codon:yes stop_codon:yes gene_type:complete
MNVLRKGYFFNNMITSAPYSFAAFHSIITSLYPSKHGVNSYYNVFKFRRDICKTLVQYLNDKGIYTEANVTDASVLPSEGFDTFQAHGRHYNNLINLHKRIISRSVNKQSKQFFLFLHNNLIADQNVINVGEKYTDFDKKYFNNYELNKKNYNSWLEKLDLYVKEIYEHIKKLGLLNDTIIILLSDHGASNGEKIGEKMYGSFTYDYTIKVFCSFLLPNTGGKEINFQTRTIDIMPTILDIFKIKVNESYEHLQGKSLIPFIEGKEKEDRIAFSETGGLNGPWPSHHKHNVFCVRLKKWKLIYNKTPNSWEMYNLKKDPGEKINVFDNNKDKEFTLKLQKILLDHIKSNEESTIYKNII